MPLQTRVGALITAIGADIKTLFATTAAKDFVPTYPGVIDYQFKAHTMDPFAIIANNVALHPGANGTLRLNRTKIARAGSVTAIHCAVRTALVTPSATNKLAVYDASGNLLAETLDLATTWAAVGYKQIPFVSPFNVTVNQYLYVASICSATTSVSLMGTTHDIVAGIMLNMGTASTRPCYTLATAGQTVFPATLALGSQPADRFVPWYALI